MTCMQMSHVSFCGVLGFGFWVLGYLFTASAAVEIARRVVAGEFKAGYQVRGV